MQRRKETHWGRYLGVTVGLAALALAANGAGARTPHQKQTWGHALPKGKHALPRGKHILPATKMVTLSGQIGGTWTLRGQVPDAGGAYQLSGNGTLAPLGPVRVAGSLQSPGLIAQGRTTGALTLTSAQGTLTLALSGPSQAGDSSQAGGSPPPSSLTYSVTGGTGAYAGEHGTGTARLVMTPERRPTPVPGRPTPQFIIAAMFTLTFGGPGGGATPAKG